MENVLFDSLVDRTVYLSGVYSNKKQQRDALVGKVDGLRTEKDILDKTETVLKHLTDKLVKKDLSKMDALVTYGLKTVYSDRNIRFQSEIMERGRKIWIDLQTIYDDKLLDPQAKSSVHVIESLLLRLLCIIKMKRARLLLLDETFANVDPDYNENLYQLMTSLCKKLGMDVLLVTHFSGHTEYVDHTYRIVGKNGITQVEKVK